jgi:F0F1-type ATP synthase assembly protein I
MAQADPSTKKSKPSNASPNNYLKYSGLAFQLLAAIGVAGWLGYLLDGYLNLKFPGFMLLFGFLAFGGMMYQIYRSINQENS